MERRFSSPEMTSLNCSQVAMGMNFSIFCSTLRIRMDHNRQIGTSNLRYFFNRFKYSVINILKLFIGDNVWR